MVLGVGDRLLAVGSLVALAAALALSVATLVRFDDSDWVTPLRERFVLGMPWGTAAVGTALVLVYAVVQGGWSDSGPVVHAFRSWSLWYPQGLALSSFAHASESHLVGNLLGTLAFAPIVEYTWRHHPGEDARIQSPAARIGTFVLVTVAVGIAGALFVPGAVIGFSGVVFALAGFALVVRPLGAVLALLGTRALGLLYSAVRDPVVTAEARPRFVSPSWADVALQGHLFGVLLGVLLAVVLLRHRGEHPPLRYVLFATLVFGVTRSLYAVYWYTGVDEFVLFRAAGAAGLFLFAVLVTLAVLPSDRQLHAGPPLRTAAAGLLVVAVGLLAVSGLAYSLVSVSPGEEARDGIGVRDYTVAYVDGVEDQYVSAVTVPGVGRLPASTVSGVVVTSDRRNAWSVDTSANRLAFDGGTTVVLGGATWRETVRVDRTEWSFLDGNSTFRVEASHDGQRRTLHTDSPAVGNARVNGTNVSIDATQTGYDLVVERDGSLLGRAPVPGGDETATFGGVTFERDGSALFARYGTTELRLAEFGRSRR